MQPGARSFARALLPIVIAGHLSAAGSCKKPKGWGQREVDYGLVEIASERIHLRDDTVGEGRFASTATFALVDAKNTHDRDLMITLGGELLDGEGKEVGELSPESLRVPSGGTRMFALIDKERTTRSNAASARIRVTGAYVVDYAPPVQITEDRVVREGDRLTVYATVNNTKPRYVKVIILAGFYDEKDFPLTRPFAVLQLAGDTSHPAEFPGPAGAYKAYIFVGDMVY
jgi:hypothetical protein